MLQKLESRNGQHCLLEGFLRTLGLAEALDKICDLDLVITLNILFEALKYRLNCCGIHSPSERVYNLDFNPPHVHGIDDIIVKPLIQQDHHTPEAIAAQLRWYKDAAKQSLRYTRAGECSTGFQRWRLIKSGLVLTHFSQTRSHLFSPEKHTEPAQWKIQEDVFIHSVVCSFGAASTFEASCASLQHLC